MRRMSFIPALAVAMAVAAVFVGCKPAQLKVAVIGSSQTGNTFDSALSSGAQMAIEEWNANGGVLGMKIVPVVEDSREDPAAAAAAARKVIDTEHVHYIIGDVYSVPSIAISEVANAAKVIQISPSSTRAGLTVDASGATKAYIFRACFTDPAQARAAAQFARGKLKAGKAFILSNPSDAYSAGLAEAFEPAFVKAGGASVGSEHYAAAGSDFAAILRKVKAAKPDVVYLPDFYATANAFMRQAKAQGMKTPFMGADGWLSDGLDLHACEGSYFTEHFWAGDPRAEAKAFVAAYSAKFKGTPWFEEGALVAGCAYDAANLLLQAIRKAGGDDVEKVKAALEGISFSGVSGSFTFDAHHDPVKAVAILHISGGTIGYDSAISP
jgi:branched-chain amino acid transport system substrate-binding protein